jgi:ribosomal protein S18 acetylase RimI-like enzyme
MAFYCIRPAILSDLPAILATQSLCYREVPPERPEIIEEKIKLYPDGCFVAECNYDIAGYLLSHPCILWHPPKINQALLAIPIDADSYYIHDVAVSTSARGQGFAKKLIEVAFNVSKQCGFTKTQLIAVQNSSTFWERYGFRDAASQAPSKDEIETILLEYQEDSVYMIRELANS